MILVVALLAGLIVGKLLGGSLRSLAGLPIKFPELLVAGFVVQLVLYTPLTDTQSWDIHYGHILYVGSMALVFGALLINIGRLRWPVVLMAAGALMNLLVIVANGGAMPVDTHLLAQAQGISLVHAVAHHTFATNVTPMNGGTRLAFLGDRLVRIADSVYSIGDITIGVGALLLVVLEMRRPRTVAVKNPVAHSSQATQAA